MLLVNNINKMSQFILGISISYTLFNLVSVDRNFQSLKEKQIDEYHESKMAPFEELNLFNRAFFKDFKALIIRPNLLFTSIEIAVN